MANPVNTLTKNAPQSQRTTQDPPQQAPIPKALVDDPEVRERVNAPEGKLKFLGHGQYANVYDLGDGRVLKLTRDRKDALAFANVLHRPSPAFAVTLDVFQLPGKPRTYGIVSERLKPLGTKEETEWNIFSALFFYRLVYPLGSQGNGINTPWAQWVHKALARWSKHVAKVGWKKQSVKEWPFDAELWERHLNSDVEAALFAAKMENPAKAKFLVQVAKALEHARIKWWDLHDQNIMRRMKGSRIVVADLGLSESPRVKIPVLGKSRGPRVFDVNAAAARFEAPTKPKKVAGGKALHPTIVAYHCGPKIRGGHFSLDYVGTGEGMSALGPGVYFSTNPEVAKQYCKYTKTPWLTKVHIKTSGIYNGIWGIPEHFRDTIQGAADQLAKEAGLKRLRSGLRLTHGPGACGDIFQHLGTKKAWKFLTNLGVTGAYEQLSQDLGFEVAVWDLSVVKILESSPYEVQAQTFKNEVVATTTTLTPSESDEEVILEAPPDSEILTALAETEDKETFQMLDSIVKEEGEKRSKKAKLQKRAIFTSDHLIVTED